MAQQDDMTPYFTGKKLYGDDFNGKQISEWYKDEAEGYANLGAKNKDAYKYLYHALNWHHGFRRIMGDNFNHALGIGSAYGDEFIPILSQVGDITIIDSSEAFHVREICGTPVSYLAAEETGNIPLEDNSFELVTCFDVLHHIPNVTHVVSEIYRCMAKDGIALVREPTISLGDWRKSRPGVTKRERGIPYDLLQDIFNNAGFQIDNVSVCMFPLTARISKVFGIEPYNNKIITVLDKWISKAFKWNYSYHRQSLLSKFCPTWAFWVLRK